MKRYFLEQMGDLGRLCERPGVDLTGTVEAMKPVMKAILERGDEAVKEFTKSFDGVELDDLEVSSAEIDSACGRVPEDLKGSLQLAARNIEKFHKAQIGERIEVETVEGVTCFQEARAIEKVGLYIPGGSAPLPSTVLMLGIPAKLAGCKEIVMCTPPEPDDAILYAAKFVGVDRVFRIGGAQAIAAMAYGTDSVPQVYKICGPGSQYVTAAKLLASLEGVAIDMPAGPTELLVIADKNARADFVAADLISQAEHGPDSQVVFVCTDKAKAAEIEEEVKKQLNELPRKDIATRSLENSFILLVENLDQAIKFSNSYAPEHLSLNIAEAEELVPKIENAGSVFIGPYSCESAGDYASGTNHTLPTYGFARSYSGVSVSTFQKQITFQKLDERGIEAIGEAVERIADCEQLIGHKRAMTLRLNSIK